MKLTIIDDLKKCKPKKRGEILHKMHARNVEYFKKRNPMLGDAIEKMGTGGFEIRVNMEFLDVIEMATGNWLHPPGRLLDYIETLSSPHHTGWIDKLEVLHHHHQANEHGRLVRGFLEGIYAKMPQISQRMRAGVIQLPRLADGRRFSGSTVFLGTLTGLQIVQYLNTTEVRDIFIIEPDPFKFALSCWFVDYAAIEKRFGRVIIHVGTDMPESPLDYLMGTSPIVASVWLRLLPIYRSQVFDQIIARTNLRWRTFHEVTVPFDREVRNLTYGAANLRAQRPILCRAPKLSANSRIAVVLSGPSLDKDIAWLKENRDRLIVFCAHSTVRILRKHGIKADFQCTLDTELEEALLAKLQMDRDVPLIAYYKCDPKVLEHFDTVLLFPEVSKANVVRFKEPVAYTHPTSGNSAVAMALFMQPVELYLLGLDLGFREARQSHAEGSWHDDEGGAGHLANVSADSVPATANFADSEGQIRTHAYYNFSRAHIEAAIRATGGSCKVYNFSDGVRIAGAEPRHSSDCMLPVYVERAADVSAIQTAFVGAGDIGWTPYPLPGDELLLKLRREFVAAVTLDKPDWKSLAAALDGACSKLAFALIHDDSTDLRYEAYLKLLQDLLAEWLRVLAFTKTPSEFKSGYEAGIAELKTTLEHVHWPDGLDIGLSTVTQDDHAESLPV